MKLIFGISVAVNVVVIVLIVHSLVQLSDGDRSVERSTKKEMPPIAVFETPELPQPPPDVTPVDPDESTTEDDSEKMAVPLELVGIIFSNKMLTEEGMLNPELVEVLEISEQAQSEINKAIETTNRKLAEFQDQRVVLDPEKVDLPGKQLILHPDPDGDQAIIAEIDSAIVRVLDPARAAILVNLMDKEKFFQVEERIQYIVWQPHPHAAEIGQEDLWQYKVYTLDEEGREGYVDRDYKLSGRFQHHFDE